MNVMMCEFFRPPEVQVRAKQALKRASLFFRSEIETTFKVKQRLKKNAELLLSVYHPMFLRFPGIKRFLRVTSDSFFRLTFVSLA